VGGGGGDIACFLLNKYYYTFFTTKSTIFLTISENISERFYRKILGSSSKVRDSLSGYKQP